MARSQATTLSSAGAGASSLLYTLLMPMSSAIAVGSRASRSPPCVSRQPRLATVEP